MPLKKRHCRVSIGTVLIDTLFRLKTNGGKIKVAAPRQGSGYFQHKPRLTVYRQLSLLFFIITSALSKNRKVLLGGGLGCATRFFYVVNPSSANLSGSDFLSRRRSLPCCGRGRGRFFVIVLQRSYCLTGTNLAEVILNVLFPVIGVSE